MTFNKKKAKFIKALLVLSISVSSLSAYSGPNERQSWSENDYWEETQLSFSSLINGLISDTNCKESIQKLVACAAVLNKMHDIEDPKNTNTVIINLDNGLSFEKVSSKNLRIKDYLIQLRDELSASFSSEALSLLDGSFSELLTEFVSENVKETNDSLIAANLYNTYLTVAVDPHSYITPKNKSSDSSQAKTDNKGIGIFLEAYLVDEMEKMLVTDVVEKSPAEKAGVKVGDIFLNINLAESFEDMMKEIKRTETFDITVLRQGENVNLTITKGIYTIVNVKSKVIESGEKSFGYIKLRTFSDSSSCTNIKKSISNFKKDPAFAGLILDLRNNGGGLVNQAVCIMENFLEPSSITWMTKDLDADELVYHNFRPKNFVEMVQEFHNVVLVNGYSASASEAVSMYLQDYQKAFIVGERTFGKGSMQMISADDSPELGEDTKGVLAAKTTALYYGPKGASPQVVGVMPDIVSRPKYEQVEVTEYLREEDRYAFPIQDRAYDRRVLINSKRIQDISLISDCMQERSEVQNEFMNSSPIDKEIFDNQLETAIATLNCANDNVKVHRGINLKQTTDLDIISFLEFRMRSFRRGQSENQIGSENKMKRKMDERLKKDIEQSLKDTFKIDPIDIRKPNTQKDDE
jgi:carboxyl-terminal processing protease